MVKRPLRINVDLGELILPTLRTSPNLRIWQSSSEKVVPDLKEIAGGVVYEYESDMRIVDETLYC